MTEGQCLMYQTQNCPFGQQFTEGREPLCPNAFVAAKLQDTSPELANMIRGRLRENFGMCIAPLKNNWDTFIDALAPGATHDASEAVFFTLISSYSESTRAYHTLRHLSEMLALVAKHRDSIQDINTVLAAIFFHDYVYKTTLNPDGKFNDNEGQSAQRAVNVLDGLGVPKDKIAKIVRYILATKSHELPDANDEDLKLFLDFDMAILAADDNRYDEYARGVAAEYAWAEKGAYTQGRIAVLNGFLAKPVIFHSDEMKPLEEKAKANIKRELENLETQSSDI